MPRTSVTASLPLLPTPTRAAGEQGPNSLRGQAARLGSTGRSLTETLTLRMLPTPRVSLNELRTTKRTPSQESGEHGRYLGAELASLKLLPTPAEADSRNTRNATANDGAGSTGHSGRTLSDVAYEWSGASTPERSPAGKRSSDLRLSPWFVEWMIGAPCGWSDPDCPLSAMEFKSSSGSSWGDT